MARKMRMHSTFEFRDIARCIVAVSIQPHQKFPLYFVELWWENSEQARSTLEKLFTKIYSPSSLIFFFTRLLLYLKLLIIEFVFEI